MWTWGQHLGSIEVGSLYTDGGVSTAPRGLCVCVPHPGLTFEHGADPPDPQAALTCKLA